MPLSSSDEKIAREEGLPSPPVTTTECLKKKATRVVRKMLHAIALGWVLMMLANFGGSKYIQRMWRSSSRVRVLLVSIWIVVLKWV